MTIDASPTAADPLAHLPRRFCSVCRRRQPATFRPGPGGRLDASCPGCGSLERHRFLALLVEAIRPTMPTLRTLLDVAPSPQVTPVLARLGAERHLRLDLGADNRLVDVLGSLTALPLPADSVDLLVCYHVLEHVPDDRTAMREIARVLSTGGLGLIQVPFRPGTTTDEDPGADAEERLRRFGQADHVRFYGDDFEERLIDAGLAITRVTPRSYLGERMAQWLKLRADEIVWVVRASEHDGDDDGVPPVVPPVVEPAQTGLTRTLDVLVDDLAKVRGKLLESRARVRELERERSVAARTPDRPAVAPARPHARAGMRSRVRRAAGRVRRAVRF